LIIESSLQGHWRRDWIKAPGFEDHTTRVHWMQAGALFADLRIPLARPDVSGLSCLSHLPQQSLAPLLTSEGFAGHITVQNSQCTWHRAINWHGVPGQPDSGLMSLAEEGLIEDGVHAEYRELWQAVPDHELSGMRVRFGAMTGVLIASDEVFLLGIGPTPQGTTERLLADLAAGNASRDALHQLFESEYVTGVWEGNAGRAQLSTNPCQEGLIVLERADGFKWHARSFDGVQSARRLEVY
jgi:hypothetical protein